MNLNYDRARIVYVCESRIEALIKKRTRILISASKEQQPAANRFWTLAQREIERLKAIALKGAMRDI